MHRTFQGFNQVLNLLIARSQARIQCDWGDLKSFSGLRIAAGGQAPAEQSVHRAFEGFAGAPLLQLHEHGNIVVNGQSGSHIMMLLLKAS
jgi:hypothetical protein